MQDVELRIGSNRRDASGIADALDRFAAAHGLSGPTIHDLQVALDEVLSNVMTHGYGDRQDGEILVRLLHRRDVIVVEVEDEGIPFDPLQTPSPDLTVPISKRIIGGLGVHFIRNLVDNIAYSRPHGRNCLRLMKKIHRI